MRPHSFDQLGHGEVFLRLGMIGRLAEIRRLEALQQSQVRMAIQPVERDQFGRRSLQAAEVPRPVILVHGRNHRLLVGEHLPQAVRVHNLDVGEMPKYLVDTPLVRSRLVAQHFLRQPRHRRRNLLRVFLRGLQIFFQFAFRHRLQNAGELNRAIRSNSYNYFEFPNYTMTFCIHSATCTFQPNSFVIASRSWDDAAGSPCTR